MVTVSDGLVRIASSTDPDAAMAATAVLQALRPADLCGIAVFCTHRQTLDAFAEAAATLDPSVIVVGCTTAGEITPWGPRQGSVTAVGFPTADFTMHALRFDGLQGFDPFAAHRTVAEMIGESILASAAMGPGVERAGLLLIDGLACREELITHTLRHLLEDIPMIGGSAGDDMAFRRTHLLHGGGVRSDCAVLTLLASRHPLRVFRCHHHEASEKLVVVTRVDTAARTVHELNGEPAAGEYARLVGVEPQRLDERIFAEHPLMVRVGGGYHARAPMRVAAGGSLVFHSAVERGLVLRLGRSTQMLEGLLAALGQWSDTAIDAVIALESAYNRIEVENAGLATELADIHADHRFVGFHSYGEQYRDLHLNRNLVGLAVGRRRP